MCKYWLHIRFYNFYRELATGRFSCLYSPLSNIRISASGRHLIHLFILHAVSCTVIQIFIHNIRIAVSHQNDGILRIQHCNDRTALVDDVQNLFRRTSCQVVSFAVIDIF